MKMMTEEQGSRPEIQATLLRILEKVASQKEESFPRITVSPFDSNRLTLSFFLLTHDQAGLGTFFYEMVMRSLPGKVSLFFLAPIQGNLVAAELELTFSHLSEWERIKGQVEMVRQELLVAMHSPYHARRLLELKGMSVEEKRIRVQERVAKIIARFPDRFDYDFFSLVQHYFVRANQEYFRFHEVQQIGDNLSGLYLIKKKLMGAMEEEPERRHLFVKVKKRRLHHPLGNRQVLGISVGLNFLREHEVFTDKHLLSAIQSLAPGASHFEESAYVYADPEYPLRLLYVEIDSEKQALLQRELPLALKGRVEHLQRPLFMPRNEEEVMRHVVTLGGQLKFSRDLPQVILSFQQQTDTKIYFTVILARVLLPHLLEAEELIAKLSNLNPQVERVKKIGMLRKKYFKEALVFKVELLLRDFLREDQSVDLYKARLFVLSALERVVGEVRDYNGGMISKQNEVLKRLYCLLGEKGIKHRLLVDNFFHALFPVEMRSLIDPCKLQKLFFLLLENLEGKETLLTREEEGVFYLILETSHKEKCLQILEGMRLDSRPVTLQIALDERCFFGAIVESEGKSHVSFKSSFSILDTKPKP